MTNKIYGYARISTAKQSLTRQTQNILKAYPSATIIEEVFTGTKTDRPEWNKLKKRLRTGDTIVFDSVSRMSRNSAEGIALYKELFESGINIIFIKESYCNSDIYRNAVNSRISLEINSGKCCIDNAVGDIIDVINDLIVNLAMEQIAECFRQSEKEVTDLHQRTSEGMRVAQAEGKQIGLAKGTKLVTKKSVHCKEVIRQHSKDFGGTLNDAECQKLCGCSRNSYYAYKRQIKEGI